MTVWDQRASTTYHRKATGMLGGFYRAAAEDIAADVEPGAVVVDVGTGPGLLLHHLADRGARLHGVDPSGPMVDIARRAAEGAGLAERLEFAAGSAQDLPFPDASVDLLVSTLSLHHWPDHPAAAAEARRVLRPGGRLLAYDFRFVRMAATATALRGRFAEVSRKPVRLLFARLAAR